jgi:hypothetical protein
MFRLMRKYLFIPLFFIQVFVLAQTDIKKVLIEGKGSPLVMLNGGVADISVFAVHSRSYPDSIK